MANNLLGLNKGSHIHFIGIGGCSMSGLAIILNNEGYYITGSDINQGTYTDLVSSKGIKVSIGHDAKNVEGADLVVYTAAVKSDNCEYMRAQELNIPIMERSCLLGEISAMYGTSLSVSGCHGKTTITSMIAVILDYAEKDITAHIGGMVKQFGGGVTIGKSDVFVTEACEYVKSFLMLSPSHVVINNLDDDHLDCYGSFENICATFLEFANKVDKSGCVYGCGDDINVCAILDKVAAPTISYGLNETNDYCAKNISHNENGNVSYELYIKGEKAADIALNIPGKHNVINSLAAVCVCHHLFSLPLETISEALATYALTGRRFEILGKKNGITVISDYAHHPTEIKACINAAMDCPRKKLAVLFQCHLYSRAKMLKDKYACAFEGADIVLVPDIYAAREINDGSIHAKDLVDAINKNTPAVYMPSNEEMKEYIFKNFGEGDIVLALGAGDINSFAKSLVK